jgi:enamine deaminase RidA (YjgF/YER057c/UK114 family)
MTKTHNPPTVWEVPANFRPIYSHAVEVAGPARLLFVSGQFGVRPDGSVSPDFATQCEQAMSNVEALLRAADMQLSSVVKIAYFLTNTKDFPALGEIRRRRWAQEEPPSVTALCVAALARQDCFVEIEAVAAG